MSPRPVDLMAGAAVLLTVVMGVVYLAVVRAQQGEVAVWYVAVLLIGTGAAGYGAVGSAPHRRPALAAAGVLLGAAGLLGILTIGLPVLVAEGLCLVVAARDLPPRHRPADGRRSVGPRRNRHARGDGNPLGR